MAERMLNEKQKKEFMETAGPDFMKLDANAISTLFAYHKNGGCKYSVSDMMVIGHRVRVGIRIRLVAARGQGLESLGRRPVRYRFPCGCADLEIVGSPGR